MDPPSIAPDVYPRRIRTDPGTLTWKGSDGRHIVGANILPVLKEGDYPPDYVFSQSDYFWQPQIDYRADLTKGTLTGTFDHEGLYHVRLIYDQGPAEINTVLIDSDTLVIANPETKARCKIPQPTADLQLVPPATPTDPLGDIASRALAGAHKPFVIVDSIQSAIDAICGESMHLGRPITVNVIGHGCPGVVQIGSGPGAGDIGEGADMSPGDFHDAIAGKVSSICFTSCNLGRGAIGVDFLNQISGGTIAAAAWTETLAVSANNTWEVNCGGVKIMRVPEPALLPVLILLAQTLRRRRLRIAPQAAN